MRFKRLNLSKSFPLKVYNFRYLHKYRSYHFGPSYCWVSRWFSSWFYLFWRFYWLLETTENPQNSTHSRGLWCQIHLPYQANFNRQFKFCSFRAWNWFRIFCSFTFDSTSTVALSSWKRALLPDKSSQKAVAKRWWAERNLDNNKSSHVDRKLDEGLNFF